MSDVKNTRLSSSGEFLVGSNEISKTEVHDTGFDIEEGLPPSRREITTSSGGHVGAMNPSGMPSSIVVDNERLPLLNRSTSSEDRGPGGCCSFLERSGHVVKAGLVQMISTALTFGTKPLVEAAVLSAFGVSSVAAAPLVATLTASVIGGVYVGVIHTTVSRLVSGLMNSALSMNTYTPNPDSHALLGEIATIDLPVMGAFVGGYTLRGMFVDGETSVLVDALSKTLTSSSAGFLQGAITDALRQTMAAYEKVYSEKPATIPEGEKMKFVKETFEKTLSLKAMSGKEFGHDIFGKTVGSTFGMLCTQLLKDRELDSPTSGAVGMTAYLLSWFTGIHTSSAIFGALDKPSSQQQTTPEDMV